MVTKEKRTSVPSKKDIEFKLDNIVLPRSKRETDDLNFQNLFNACTEHRMTAYGFNVFCAIKVARHIMAVATDYQLAVDVYVTTPQPKSFETGADILIVAPRGVARVYTLHDEDEDFTPTFAINAWTLKAYHNQYAFVAAAQWNIWRRQILGK